VHIEGLAPGTRVVISPPAQLAADRVVAPAKK